MGSSVYRIRLVIMLLLLISSGQGHAESLHISFVVPDQKGPIFWELVAGVAMSASQDLGAELEIINSDSNRFASKQVIEKIVQRVNKPDYLVFRPFQGNAREIFDLLERNQIPFVTLEQAFEENEIAEIGLPRQKYHYWLGQINYDNAAGGELLTRALLKRFRKSHPKNTFFITGIGGDFDGVSKARQANLETEFQASENIFVNQIFPMYWSPIMVQDNFSLIHTRYPNTSAYWCAGDQMALEVIEQLKLINPNATYLVGGFDWLPQALEKIKTGEMTASVGGHFLMAAMAVLKIVDYHNGTHPFLTEYSPELFELIDTDNIGLYLPFLKQAPWPNVDFRQFSKSKHKGAELRKLTVANLLQAYSKTSN